MESDISKIIDFLMNGSISIIGVAVGYFIAEKKYIFQKTYDRKLILIANLHTRVVRLEFELKKYIHFIGAHMEQEKIDEKRNSLNKITSDFQLFQHKFWEVDIFLDDSLNDEIKKFIEKYIEITSKLLTSNYAQQLGCHNEAFNCWYNSLTLVSPDLVKIKNKLKEEFRKTLSTNS